METIRNAMLYATPIGPVWSVLIMLVGLPLANEVVQRTRGTRAESLLQGLALFLLRLPAIGIVIAKTPIVGDLLYVFAPQNKTGIPTPLIAKPSVVVVPEVQVTVTPTDTSMRVLVPVFLALGLSLSACAPAIVHARQAVSAAAALGSTAGDLFGAVDAQEQRDIAAALVKDHDIAKAERARDEWRAKQATSVKALKIYATTVTGLGALAELEAQNGKLNLGQMLAQLATAYAQLVDVLKAFGVSLPRET